MSRDLDSTEPGAARPARRRRWTWVVLLLVLAVMALLGTGAGNEVLWRWAAARIEASSGWRVDLENPRLGWGVEVAAESIEVTTPEGRRLAAAERLRGRLRPGALFRARRGLRIERVRIDGLWFDPSALPVADDEPADESAAYPLEIVALEVRGGTVPGQRLEPPLEVPLGARGLELAEWSASGWNLEGSVSIADQVRYQLLGGGRVNWRGDGLEDGAAQVTADLDGREPGLLGVKAFTARGDGIDATLEAEIGFTDSSPLRIAGRLKVEPADLLVDGELDAATASLSWSGDVDLRSRLGEFRGEVSDVPLRWAWTPPEGTQDESSALALDELGRLASALWVDATLDYRAQRTPSGDLSIEVAALGTGERARERLLDVDFAAREGRIDEAGHVDLTSLRWSGSARARGSTTVDLTRLLPRSVRETVEATGLGDRPFELALDLAEVSADRSRGQARFQIGSVCGDLPEETGGVDGSEPPATPPCPRLDIAATELEIAFAGGTWDPSALSASVQGSFDDVRGEPLRGLLTAVPASAWQQWIEGEDRVAGEVRADVRGGRIEFGGAGAELEWSTGAAQTSGEAPGALLRLSAAAREPRAGEALRLGVRASVLGAEPGTRSLTAELIVPSGFDWSVATSSGSLELRDGLPLLLEGAMPWIEDTSSLERLAARLDSLDAPFQANLGWSGRLSDPELGVRATLRSSEANPDPLIRLQFDSNAAGASAASAGVSSARLELQLDDAREEAAAGGVARSLLAAWIDLDGAGQVAEALPWFPSEGRIGIELDLRWPRTGPLAVALVPAGLDEVSGRLSVDGVWLRLGTRWLETAQLVLAQDREGPLLVESAVLRGPFSSLRASGVLEWQDDRRVAQALQLDVSGGASRYGLEEFEGTLRLDREQLQLEASRLTTAAGDGRGRLAAPLASLASLEPLRGYLQALGARGEAGPVLLEIELPLLRVTDRNQADLEFGPLPSALDTNAFEFEDLRLTASIALDDLQSAEAGLEARSVRLAYRGYDVRSREPMRASLGKGIARLESLRFAPSSPYSVGADAVWAGEQLLVRGRATLAARHVDDLLQGEPIIEDLRVDMEGPVELALLQEFVSPARIEGLADVEVAVRGEPGALTGELKAEGRNAAVRLLDPYVTELTDLTLAARLEEGLLFIDELAGRLNRGRIRIEGTVDELAARLVAELDQVRYRVDYGLSTEISGRLDLDLPILEAPPDARGSLKGRIDIEQGTLRRELNLDRELRTLLFAPAARPGQVDPYAERIALDLDVVTSQGIRIRNNVADARASWDELRVRGTLAAPLVEGVVEADPGGLVTAYGQTFRIDQGEARFTGQPGVAPEIVLDTTSSIEDPSIRRSDGSDLDPFSTSFGSTSGTTDLSRREAFAGGLADYFGNELATGLGQGLTRVFGGALNVRPVLVFGETEPSARLIVTREVDENVDIGVSVELRNPEDRLYLVDLHDFAVAPSLSAQIFTNESGNEGLTLQQNLNLGGSESSPFLVGEIDLRFEDVGRSAEERISERRVRRSLTIRGAERWVEGMDFDAEIDVVDSLRKAGFPSPEVDVEVRERGRRRDLLITVQPGIPAEIRFEGLEPAGIFRDAIRQTYRNDFFRQAALQEIERQTERALEAQGWAQVRTDVALEPADSPDGVDRVTVTSSSPRRLPIDRLSLSGVGREAALAVESVLTGRGAKIALLEGDEATRDLVLEQLAALGWTDARILRVDTDREGRALVIDFDLRLRARIAGLSLVGFDESTEEGLALEQEIASQLKLQPGDPAIQREIAAAAIAAESALRDRGYIDARVRTELLESLSGPMVDPFVQLAADLGVKSRVAEIAVPDEGRASPNWLREFIDIEPGAVVDRSQLRATRRRILGTGVFSSVRFETLRTEGPQVDGSEDEVTLALRTVERPRWKLAYGTRWESEEGFGVVVDGLDRNLLGRGLQLGARALWTERRRAARGFLGVPDMFGSKLSFESFLELRERDVDGIRSTAEEATFQLAYPLRPTLSGRVYLRLRSEEERELALGTDPVRTQSPVIGTQFIYDGRSGTSSSERDDPVVGSTLQANALLRGLEGSLGTFASIDLSQSAEFLNNDFDYVRAFAQVFHSRRAFDVGDRRVVWAQSWRLGVIENSGPELPIDQRFLAGGEYSVRGYGRESLGPQETTDDGLRALGGEALFVVNQELRFPVAGDFEGVVLIDSGNVWDDVDELFDEFLSSAGLGVRYRSPLGLLRFDVAVPLDRREGDDSVRFYLGFGHVF